MNILYTIISGYHNYIMFEMAIHMESEVPFKKFCSKSYWESLYLSWGWQNQIKRINKSTEIGNHITMTNILFGTSLSEQVIIFAFGVFGKITIWYFGKRIEPQTKG